jgi:hypothetical protein
MTCAHVVCARDPTDHAVAHHDHVCLTCGIIGRVCDRCTKLIPHGPMWDMPESWCYWCWCCVPCCGQTDQPLTPADIMRAIESSIRSIADEYIRRCIIAAATRDEAIAVARRECSRGGHSSNSESVMGFRDSYNRGRGLTAQFSHRKGVVTWAQIADYVRAPQDAAHAAIPAQQLALFG